MKRLRRSTSSTTEEQHEGHTPKWRELSSPASSGEGDSRTINPASSDNDGHSEPEDHKAGVRSNSPPTAGHKAVCPTCHTTFTSPKNKTLSSFVPTASWLLDLHFTERHDPLAAVKRDERGEKIYRCFVKDCEKVCSEVKKRRWHVEAKHPGLWGDGEKDWGLRGRRKRRTFKGEKKKKKKKQRERFNGSEKGATKEHGNGVKVAGAAEVKGAGDRRSEGQDASPREGVKLEEEEDDDNDDDDDAMEGLTSGLSALRFVPPSVRFGRGGKRGGLAKG